MKIKDIIVEEPIVPSIKQTKFQRGTPNDERARINKIAGKSYRKFNPVSGIDFLGKGVQAYAVSKKDKPHEVKKIVFEGGHPTKDPYFKFLKIAIKNQDSIFMPKVYSIKIFKYAKGPSDSVLHSYSYHVEMERLVGYTALNWGQWSHLFRTYLGTPINKIDDIDSKAAAATYFAEILNDLINVGSHPREVKISNELMPVLKKLARIKNVYHDLHLENMMYRITPYGVQPVIADPFYYS